MSKLIVIKEYDEGFEELIESFLLSDEQFLKVRKLIVKQIQNKNKSKVKGLI